MNKIVATISLAAMGTTALHAYMPGTSPHGSLTAQERAKPWSVGVELRGFYDDNYLTRSRNLADTPAGIPSSFGFDVRPSVGINLPMEKTFLGTEVTYSAKWYEDRSDTDEPWDQSLFWDTSFNHSFTPQQNVEIDNRFIYSDEPQLGVTGGPQLRTDQNYIYNRGSIAYTAGLSRRSALVFGYNNNYWNYEQSGSASLSARLDRIDQTALANFRYQLAPETVGFIGYNYRPVCYTGDEFIQAPPPGRPDLGLKSDTRNSRSHIGYIGVEHNFTRLMSFSIDGGVQFVEFYNNMAYDPVNDRLVDDPSDDLSPYGNVSYTYRYLPGSSFTVGGRIFRQATEIAFADPADGQTQDQLASSVYADLSHEIFPRLTGSVFGRWQYAVYNGGPYDKQDENWYIAGLRFVYSINKFLSATAGYTFTYLDSPVEYTPGINRGYTRNRVWIGIAATY